MAESKQRKSRDTSPCQKMTKEEIITKMQSSLSENKYGKLEESLEAMKKVSLSIGIIGPSAVGKSSFINSMLGLEEDDVGAAKIGVGDTTTTKTVYCHPNNRNLEFHDLPGYGTPTFKLNGKYMETNDVENLDFLLIFYATTISDKDMELVSDLTKLKKKFALVRTRADDLYGKKKSLEQGIAEVKMIARKNLEMSGINEEVEIFVISNQRSDIGEFDQLFEYIQGNLPELKRDAIIVYAHARTDKIIEMKKKVLEERAWKVAATMGATTAIPIPGVSILINQTFLMDETKCYLEIFGFTEELMQKTPAEIMEQLKTVSKIKAKGIQSFIVSILAQAPAIVSAALVEQAIELLLPVIGSLITGSVSYAYSLNFLNSLITELACDAKTLRKLHVESFMKR